MTDDGSDLLIGKQFGKEGRLLIQAKLKEGGIGFVYEALDSVKQRKVAMKFLKPDFSQSSESIARFKREGQRFTNLKHPNIVKVYGLGREHGLLYIACEFVEGRNLAEVLKDDGPFSVDRALQVGRDIASALKVAHEANVVHRDLKPENIMIRNGDGQVMLLDFGIAKQLDSGSMLTKVGAYLGTPGYSAPEQIRGKDIDHRTDIFPMGAILYELLTGKLAFNGRHTTQILSSTLNDRPLSMKKVNEKVIKPVAKLIEKMMQKHPARRYQSMGEVIEAIDGIRQSLAEGVSQEEKAGITGSFKRLFGH